ncbi:MAG TPA: aspartate kinase [Fibrobacteres bacterium]|jgi:aspartate kinase|nr:aspartate kinase [Fibrobacterota bacterium]
MNRIASKFGGSSVADHRQFLKIQAILEKDKRRSVIVVSAPGKRHSGEAKLTDLLYLCHELAKKGMPVDSPFSLIRDRFLEIEKELKLNAGIAEEMEKFHRQIVDGVDRDFIASRGEYFSGRLMAKFLNAVFVEPGEAIFFDKAGRLDPKSYDALGKLFSDPSKRYVMPGFYGADAKGRIKTFSRGGSDISGAIAARAAKAELYENWTDVSGLLMADPRIVENPHPLDIVSYREIRELSYMGASVFHDEAIAPVREAGIPINIRNTNKPDDAGTMIVSKLPEVTRYDIAGVAGKKNFSMFSVEKTMMNKEVGFARKFLELFENHQVSIEHCPTSIDTMSVVVASEEIGDKSEAIREDVLRILQPDNLDTEHELSLIAVVGEGMARQSGMAARVFKALADARVNVRIIDQGASELNIIVGVANGDYEKAIRALYGEMTRTTKD